MNELKKRFWAWLVASPDGYISRKVLHLAPQVDESVWRDRLIRAQVPAPEKLVTYTSSRELRALYTLASQCCENAAALEIGAHFGAASCYLAAGLSNRHGHLYCVDTWKNQSMIEGEEDTYTQFLENTTGLRQWITPIRKWSSELCEEDIECPLSLVFIDGDHRYEAVKSDFERVQDWLSPEGLIAFHDFSNPDYEGVSRVVGEAIASGAWQLMGKVDTLAWIRRAHWRYPKWLELDTK